MEAQEQERSQKEAQTEVINKGSTNNNPEVIIKESHELSSTSSSNINSPSHEFSFTISLHSSMEAANKTKLCLNHDYQPPLPLIDLSPADEIFFHGHLLPLHFLSHPSYSNSTLDNFTLPGTELLQQDQKPTITLEEEDDEEEEEENCISYYIMRDNYDHQIQTKDVRKKPKSSFSLFGKLKRYITMVKPFLSHNKRGRREKAIRSSHHERESYSFSGSLISCRDNNYNNNNNRREVFMRGGRRGKFSEPVSMVTSPTNSGLLYPAGVSMTSSPAASDSTMEELQSAIQAAIAHCKNSIAT